MTGHATGKATDQVTGGVMGRLIAAALLLAGASATVPAEAQTQSQPQTQAQTQTQTQPQTQPKSYPGWTARRFEGAQGPVVEEAVLVCNGPDCAGEALSCTTFHGPGPNLHKRMDLSLLGGGLPLPDISLWSVGKIAKERGDLFGDPAQIKGQPPRMGYRADRQSNYPYIVATGRLETRKRPARVTVALWAGEETLYGLRCAALDDTDGKAEKHVRQLIAALLADAG